MNNWVQDLSRCSSNRPQKLSYRNSQKCCPSALKTSLSYKITAKTFVERRCIVLPIYYIHDSCFVIFLWRTWYLSADYVQLCISGSISNRHEKSTRVETLIVATIYLQLIQNRYTFRRFTVLHCSHQHCVEPVASDVEVVGYL